MTFSFKAECRLFEKCITAAAFHSAIATVHHGGTKNTEGRKVMEFSVILFKPTSVSSVFSSDRLLKHPKEKKTTYLQINTESVRWRVVMIASLSIAIGGAIRGVQNEVVGRLNARPIGLAPQIVAHHRSADHA